MRKSSVSKFICTIVKTIITCKIIAGEDENWNKTNICGWILGKNEETRYIYIYIVQNSKELFIDISERTKRYLK